MTDTESPEDEDGEHAFVYCANCGSKAPASWSFCRSCESSLDDADPPGSGLERLGIDDKYDMEESGCPKCGHDEAEVDKIATTGTGPTALFDLQNRFFQIVSCKQCGYTEFYRDQDRNVVIDLFLGG